ncbi:hypothetical protein FKM82_009178 [Ascaphus truei]
MEDWISSLKSVQSREHYETAQFNVEHFSGMHNWYACSHARPTFCNVCRESLSGVTSHGLSCEVCKFKAHKRCAVRATNNCKWTTLASIGKDIIEDDDGIAMPHQWLEGNLPVSAKCAVCDKTCGSVLRLQDWRCLWCKAMVHTACKDQYPRKCPLGQCKVSIIPPTALNSIDSDGFWKATCPPSCASPLLVFVNSKSGDNQGVKFLRRFKQLLNPAQVFDLMNGGPHLGLRLFQKFDNFRILVCGGDGSVGWVLSEIDKLSLHKQCQLGVLPLGTGNDLARVLGWGGACDDDTQLPQILEKLERASTKMLDRWSIMSYELKLPSKLASILPITPEEESEECQFQISAYEDSVATHLAKILNSDKHSVVISSANKCEMFCVQAFENTLKSWEDKQKYDSCKLVLRPHLYPQQAVDLASEEEVTLIHLCSQGAEELITRICEAAKIHSLLEQELAHAVNACSHALNKANPRIPESLTRNTAIEVAVNVKALHNETESLLVGRVPLQLESHHEELLSNALHNVEVELTKLAEIPWLYYVLQPDEEEDPPLEYSKRNSRSTVFRIVPKFKKEKVQKHKTSPPPGSGDNESGSYEANSAGN